MIRSAQTLERAILLLIAAQSIAFSQEPQATRAVANLIVEVSSSANPIKDAVVTVAGTAIVTDSQGMARTTVPLGSVNIKVSKKGFLTANSSLSLDDQTREWHLRFNLQPDQRESEEVTVYATRTDRRLQDLPTRVEVLNREEIEEKMLMTPGDITMMLNEMGGMRVQTTSPSLGAASVRIQGMRGRYTRFLSDGLPLFGQQGGGLGLLQIPPMDLGQVEVIKGAASALYGAGAMAGVVNLIARRPQEDPTHDLLFNRTTLGGTDASVFLASKLTNAWSASLLSGGHWQDQQDLDGDSWADLAGYSRGIVRPRFFWDNGSGKTAVVTAGVTYENREGGTLPGATLQATGSPFREALDTRRYDFGGSLQSLTRDNYLVTARFAASSQHHTHVFGDVLERDRHTMLFGELSMRGTSARHTWVTGAAIERDAYAPRDVPSFRYVYLTPAVFAQDDIEVTPWLSLSASARIDFHNRYGTFFSPRFAALLRWKGWTSRVSAGQGFFAPTPLTEDTEAAGLKRLVIPLLLVAEKGKSLSLDLTRTIGPGSYTFTFFASRIKHPIEVERSTRYQLVNLPVPTTNTGVELLGTFRKAPFTITGSYTYVHSREWFRGGRLDVPLTPRHSAGLVAMWEKENTSRIGLECYYTGRQRLEENPYRPQSKPYVIFGALFERRVGPVRVFLNAENLSNIRQTRWDPLLRPTRASDGRWTVDAWAPLDGRVFNGGVRF